jgi:5-methylcytosine-specific restriction enzyme A
MPWAAPRFCSKPGHPRFTGARCPICAQAARKAWDATRPSASRRGYDAAWRSVRADFLRAFPMCCRSGCAEPATEVDHIVSIANGGARLDPANLRPLCKRHHSQRTAREQGFGRSRPAGG